MIEASEHARMVNPAQFARIQSAVQQQSPRSDAEKWLRNRQDSEEYSGEDDETLDAKLHLYRTARRVIDSWDEDQRRGLSLGMTDYSDAVSRGYRRENPREDLPDPYENPGGGWQDIPSEVYHVTTNAPAVMREGLKGRADLGQRRGLGLGGGSENAISLTSSPHVAQGVLSGLHVMHKVLNGVYSADDLEQFAREGHEGSNPFHADFVDLMRGNFGYKDSRDMVREITPAWREPGGSKEVPLSPERVLQRRADAAGAFLWTREQAGGPENPLFVGTDYQRLRKMNPAQFAILRYRGVGQGYPLGGMAEWRTHHGSAVRLER